MGLDVGVVKITYMARPEQPMYDFLFALAGMGRATEWAGGWDGNTFLELTRRKMAAFARLHCRRNGLSATDRGRINEWIDTLPWEDDYVMLHLNW